MRFAKGHGTGNDFLILPDPDDALDLSPELVARLCDRRTGLGADGVLRVVRTDGRVPAGGRPGRDGRPEVGHEGGRGGGREDAGGSGGVVPPGQAQWFMDYRNADGSVAEMCGNGARVFARYLLSHGLADGPAFTVATRAGARQVWAEPGGEITVDMGAPAVLGRGRAVVGGRECEGLAVSLGNPHLACLVDVPVADFDLSAPPLVDHGQFPDGVNVEVLQVTADSCAEMRVYERGSGATLSCGTGAVAAAVAAAMPDRVGTWTVRVPGGRLAVTLGEATSLLTGPAVIVAEGEIDESWLAGQAAAAPVGRRAGC
jgi:diaminopimelate epimerase